MRTKNIFPILMLLLTIVAFLPAVSGQTGDALLSATLMTQYPDPARAGDVAEIRIRLENVGDKEASAVIGEIIEDYPFTLLPGQKAQTVIGNLPNWPKEANFKTLLYKMQVDKNAIDGQHELDFRYSLNGGLSWIVKSFNIDVTSKEFAQIIYIDKSQVNPGEETPITFTINNIGKAPLTNMVFTWEEKDNVILPINTDNTRYIPYLGVGERIDLKYTVVADPGATRGLYNLDLTLTFDTKNESGSTSDEIKTKAGVLVGGETDFDVAFAETSAGKTSFTIANIGENDASSVTITIPEQEGFKVQGGNSVIIGNLNKGDFTLATFQLSSPPTTEKNARKAPTEESKNLQVGISFTDSFGKRHLIKKQVPLKASTSLGQDVTAARTQQGPGAHIKTSLRNILVVVVILAVAIFVYRKHKQGKPVLPKKITDFWHKIWPKRK
ncbi:MAG: COG1361 S-layer family protein [Nanoarchaeota archaeon]